MPRVVFREKSKTGLGFENGHRQQKCWRTPNVYLTGNPAVELLKLIIMFFLRLAVPPLQIVVSWHSQGTPTNSIIPFH